MFLVEGVSEIQVALPSIFVFQAVRFADNLAFSFICPSCLLHWRYSVPLFSRLLFAWRYVVQFRWRCLWSNHADRNDPSKPRTSFALQTHWWIASPRNRGFFPYIFPSGKKKKINLLKLLIFFCSCYESFNVFLFCRIYYSMRQCRVRSLPFAT